MSKAKTSKPFIHPALFWAGLGAIMLLFLVAVSDILLPFVIGVLVAYLLNPLVEKLTKFVRSRTLASVVVLCAFIAIVALLAIYLLPYIYDQLQQLAVKIPSYINHIIETYQPRIDALSERLESFYPEGRKPDLAVVQNVSSSVMAWIAGLLKSVVTSGVNMVNLLSLIFISPIVSLYLLKDWHAILTKLSSLLPKKHKKTVMGLVREMDGMIAAYLRGMLMVAVILAVFYATGLGLAGLNYGVPIGIVTGFLSFIPYVGVLIGVVVSMIVAVFQYSHEWMPILTVLLVFGVGQFIEGNFITPKIVGESLGLHPVWIIFALLSGGVLLGFVGVVLAVPVAAIIGVLTRFGIQKYQQSALAA
jgi:predicted PurR-regulated permease PerM